MAGFNDIGPNYTKIFLYYFIQIAPILALTLYLIYWVIKRHYEIKVAKILNDSLGRRLDDLKDFVKEDQIMLEDHPDFDGFKYSSVYKELVRLNAKTKVWPTENWGFFVIIISNYQILINDICEKSFKKSIGEVLSKIGGLDEDLIVEKTRLIQKIFKKYRNSNRISTLDSNRIAKYMNLYFTYKYALENTEVFNLFGYSSKDGKYHLAKKEEDKSLFEIIIN